MENQEKHQSPTTSTLEMGLATAASFSGGRSRAGNDVAAAYIAAADKLDIPVKYTENGPHSGMAIPQFIRIAMLKKVLDGDVAGALELLQ